MDVKQLNSIFQITQSTQLALLSMQGLLLIFSQDKSFYVPIWVGILICSLIQVLIVFKYPAKIESNQIVAKSAMIRLRMIAVLPYLLIFVGLLTNG